MSETAWHRLAFATRARVLRISAATAVLASLAAVVLVAACFSEKTSTAPSGVGCEVPLEIIEAGHTVISIRSFRFIPDTLSIESGTTVTWVNCEPPEIDAHTSTSDEGVWGSELLDSGDTFTRTFNELGEFPYHCIPHPFMRGEIVVE